MHVDRYALIMAAGEGRRTGMDIPKQFVKLLGIPMLWWSVMAYHQADPDTVIKVVLHPGFFDDWDIMLRELPEQVAALGLPPELALIDVDVRAGGRSRSESVMNGLMSVPDNDTTLVSVHDAARPLVTPEIIAENWRLAEKFGNATVQMAVTDSLRRHGEGDDSFSVPVDRNLYNVVQTPQTFTASLLHKAFRLTAGKEFTDEASRVQQLDIDCLRIIESKGLPSNIKVTHPTDFAVAETLLRLRLDNTIG